ncbi:MAG TPA: bifunctional DNA-formamidopyrimidine glycosylase/DNA-(apurinic or apyrimidinic site) lyase [Acidimicrobiales bacterium]|nr:bifunctional DNA-formamidopyrimidine glycosylase/DNA-(apurinic or apyrimidinic site) lyase [Acidimicrobiales bacterium]
MPELPEVETVRAALSRELAGKKLKTVTVTNGKLTKRHKSVKEFRTLLEGHTIKSVGRLGKNLVIGLDTGNHLVIHLGMSGQLLRAKGPKDPKPKHTHVVFAFNQGGELRYVDPRMFGELYVSVAPPEGTKVEVSPYARLAVGGDGVALRGRVPELADLGIDPVEDVVGWDRLAAILRDRSTPLKALLTDQHVIAGIGNIYADEILYTAGLRYDRPSSSLSTIEVRRLHRSIGEVLAEAIKHGGSTLSDEQFVDPDGKPGGYQLLHDVYGREGEPCHRCRMTVKKVTVRGRATYFCENCQA